MPRLLVNLSTRQKITIAVVILIAAVGIYALVQHNREAGFRPLFTGVGAEDAAGIVQRLKEAGVEYRIGEGGASVLVPSEKLAELRLTMAAAGLPKTGRIGFELFDRANLGATEFTEHVNFRRALEGELERSIIWLAEVDQARVHLTFPKDSVFLESRQPAKASVMLKLKPGAKISAQNVMAVNHLLSSAVEGLSPDAVSVLDMNGNLLGRPKGPGLNGPEPSEAVLDFRHRIESDLLVKINSTLEPLLGAGRFRAGVSVDCDYAGGEQSEETFDPTKSVMVSSQRSEDASGGSGSATGVPGTASTLPRPASRPGGTARSLSRMTENITYQTSRTVKKTRLPAGEVRRMSLAVLVDQQLGWEIERDKYKRILTPPSPEKLKIIRDMVAGVTGFVPERGDQLVIETLPFETTLSVEPPALPTPPPPAAPPGAKPLERLRLVVPIAVGVLLLAAFLFALVRRRKKKAAISMPGELAAGADTPALEGAIENRIESTIAEREALQKQLDEETIKALNLAPVVSKTTEVLARHLREKVANNPEGAALVLRGWLKEGDSVS